mgnify:CR=1 FL=1
MHDLSVIITLAGALAVALHIVALKQLFRKGIRGSPPLRIGAYGDAFGARPDGLTLQRLKDAPHGIDLGPLRPSLLARLETASGCIEAAPPELLALLDEFLIADPKPMMPSESPAFARSLAAGAAR